MKPNCEIFVRYSNGDYDSVKVVLPLFNGQPDLARLPLRLRGQDYKMLSHKMLEVPSVPNILVVQETPPVAAISAIPTKLDLQCLQQKFNTAAK
jgi:hypothetical protein